MGASRSAARGGSDRAGLSGSIARKSIAIAPPGLIGEAEAEAARVEVSRRLLAAADAETPAPAALAAQPVAGAAARAAIAAIVIVPVFALGLYLDARLAECSGPVRPSPAPRIAPAHQSIASLVSQVEAHLARNPNDGAGWEVIAPVYLRLGRFDDAVAARRKSIALNGETAAREADLGEALVAAANGVVTDEAKQAFERAVARDAHEAKARYFLGLADEQDGNRDGRRRQMARHARRRAAPARRGSDFVRTALGARHRRAGRRQGPARPERRRRRGRSEHE